MTWILESADGNTREFDSRSDAEDTKAELESLGVDVTLRQNGTQALPEPGETQVSQDPIAWMPEHFVDTIEGVPTINRKGYAVLAEHYGIQVQADPVTLPSETDFEYAEFRATAETPEGRQYSGFGSAHVDRGDDPTLLAEMAETRAMKRACAWATGVGMTAVEELQGGMADG